MTQNRTDGSLRRMLFYVVVIPTFMLVILLYTWLAWRVLSMVSSLVL